MAEVAEDSKLTENGKQEQESVDVTANGEKSADAAQTEAGAVEEAVKPHGETHDEEKPEVVKDGEAKAEVVKDGESRSEAVKDTADKQNDHDVEMKSEASGSKSPEEKRKGGPVSISAHERHERQRNRGGARYNSNIKTRFENLPESNDPDEIRRQVEFYFSDSNLPIDLYLLQKTGGYRNRPVWLKTIHNFKRMQHFQPFSAVRDAVKQSKFLDLNDDDEITRIVPLDEKFTDDPNKNRTLVHTSSMPRSIYAKGFGEETKTTQLDIEAFFEAYGPPKSIRLRRSDDGGRFKGSVFVEFEDDEAQHRFLELDPKPKWNDKDLEIMSKQEYVDMKHQGIMDGVVKPRSPHHHSNRGDRKYAGQDRRYSGGYDDRRDRRGSRDYHDKDDWKGRRDRDQEDDRRGRRGGYRGRGGGRGDRRGRGGRRPSPSFRDKRKRRRDDDEDEERSELDKKMEKGEKDDVPSRPEAELKKAKLDGDAGEPKAEGESTAGAKEAKTNGEAIEKVEKPAVESKKRALDEGESQGEAKKVKAEDNE